MINWMLYDFLLATWAYPLGDRIGFSECEMNCVVLQFFNKFDTN